VGNTSLKQQMVETIQQLPEDATVEDAIERLYFLSKIDLGIRQAEQHPGVPHDELKRQFFE
jgi:hypothetical protein